MKYLDSQSTDQADAVERIAVRVCSTVILGHDRVDPVSVSIAHADTEGVGRELLEAFLPAGGSKVGVDGTVFIHFAQPLEDFDIAVVESAEEPVAVGIFVPVKLAAILVYVTIFTF